MADTIAPADFRRILSHYPTGVCAITTVVDGQPVGMIVGSFSSVSLEPPLVAFFPDRRSTTWPRVEAAGAFCVNVLGAGQHAICEALSRKGGNKFEGLDFAWTDDGLPAFAQAVIVIECALEAVHEAGDHFIAVGRVRSLTLDDARLPMLFHQGRYASISAAAGLS